MTSFARRLLRSVSLAWLALLCACGGGNSSATIYSGGGLNSQGQDQAVALPYVQTANNLAVSVQAGIGNGFSLSPNANILYASVKLCAPGSQTQCQTIDNVQVDTGSVGLRIMASQVSALNLPAVQVSIGGDPVWECYGFVIGGFWGSTAVADIQLGQQTASAVPIQLIQDNPSAALQATPDCSTNGAQGQVLGSAAALGANGILGIGDVTLDCGSTCVDASYTANGTYIQYYTCPVGANSSLACSAAALPLNAQVYNPIAALPAGYNNGVVLVLPSVGGLGAASASGELIFGINTPGAPSNNQLGGLQPIYLGSNYSSNPNSYLNVTTTYQGQVIANSYLDTGSNAYFFNDASIATCSGSGMSWYCPANTLQEAATLSDGDNPAADQAAITFSVGNANSYFLTNNAAFGALAGTASPIDAQTGLAPTTGAESFAWGLPFFYGKRVYLSIWDMSSTPGPWYAWSAN